MRTPSTFRSLALSILFLAHAGPASSQLAEQGPKEVAEGSRVMVSGLHPEATRAMLEVLRQGGNAVDAAIVGTIAETVLLPHLTTLAGGMGGLIYWAETGELLYLDGELDFTSRGAPISRGYGTPGGPSITSGSRIGVPGMLRGLQAAAERYGTLTWDEYVAPAVRFARDGYPMYSFLYGEMWPAIDRLSYFESGRDQWTPSGVAPLVGETFRQPRLATTLEELGRQGPDYFYSGAWARRFVEEVNRTGGSITLDDLAAYQAQWREPLRTTFQGHTIVAPPPASNAGIMMGIILNILEEEDLQGMGHFAESPEALYRVRQAFDLGIRDMERWVGDPAAHGHATEVLLSKEYAGMLRRLLQANTPTLDLSPRFGQQASRGTIPADGVPSAKTETIGTSHIVIVDEAGNWVTLTHTVYGSTFGTGLVVDGVGVNTGNTFPGVGVGPARRVVTPFPATMVVDDGDRPWLALGSPGFSSRAVTMVLLNMLGYGMELDEAINAPRFRGFHPGETLMAESRVSRSALDGLARFGVRTGIEGTYHWRFGSIQAVMQDRARGIYLGATDPRRTGYAEGY